MLDFFKTLFTKGFIAALGMFIYLIETMGRTASYACLLLGTLTCIFRSKCWNLFISENISFAQMLDNCSDDRGFWVGLGMFIIGIAVLLGRRRNILIYQLSTIDIAKKLDLIDEDTAKKSTDDLMFRYAGLIEKNKPAPKKSTSKKTTKSKNKRKK